MNIKKYMFGITLNATKTLCITLLLATGINPAYAANTCHSDIIFRNNFEYNLTPTDLSAVALNSHQVQLMWMAPEGVSDVAGYRILESGAVIGTTTTVAYLHVGRIPEMSYTYTIEAFNTAGENSNPTVAESVTTPSETAITALETVASAMAPGEWTTFVTEGFDNGNIFVTPEQGRITEFTTEAIWDPVGRRVFVVGTARANGYGICNQKWVQWSETTNVWTALPKLPFYLGFHSYEHAALDSNTGDYYLRKVGTPQIHHYDASNGDWGVLPDLPISGGCCHALEFFADMDSLVYTHGANNGNNTKIFQYVKSSSSWQQLAIGQNLPMGRLHDISEYSPVHGVLFFGGGNAGGSASGRELYRLDASGNVMRLADAPVEYRTSNTVIVADPNTGNLLLFPNSTPDTFYEHVLSNNTWVTHDLPVEISMVNGGGSMIAVAAPIPELGVIMFAQSENRVGRSLVYLYKHQP